MDSRDVIAQIMLTGDVSRVVERVERNAQHSLANGTLIPVLRHGVSDASLQSLGFGLSDERVDGVLQKVRLPNGWRVHLNPEHELWSALLDGNGRKRARIFYKAVPWRPEAEMWFTTRYTVESGRVSDDPARPKVVRVLDSGSMTIWESEPNDRPHADMNDELLSAAAWLNDQYPDWQNPLAYW